MTTRVTVEVPSGADYNVIVDIKERAGLPTSEPSYIERSAKVSPGDMLTVFIYGDQKFISGIREVKRNRV